MYSKGAHGFLIKTLLPEELILAITEVMNGKLFYYNNINPVFLKSNSAGIEHAISKKPEVQEMIHEIIYLLCMDKDNHEISKILNTLERTIEKYRGILNGLFGTKNINGILKFGNLFLKSYKKNKTGAEL